MSNYLHKPMRSMISLKS